MSKQFQGVYMLYSKNNKYYGRIYIGYTVNPSRRINQHNKGKQYGGAKKTEKKGPWEMALIVHGFPTEISALRFEWAWQHPQLAWRRLDFLEQRRQQESPLDYHLRILDRMISSSPWVRLPLTIQCLNSDIITSIKCSLPNVPVHMEILHGPITPQMDAPQNDSWTSCGLCMNDLKDVELIKCYHECHFVAHSTCLAAKFLNNTDHILPVMGKCPSCQKLIIWGKLV